MQKQPWTACKQMGIAVLKKKMYLQKQVMRQIWPIGPSLVVSLLEEPESNSGFQKTEMSFSSKSLRSIFFFLNQRQKLYSKLVETI